MKKLFAIICAALIGISLTACGNESKGKDVSGSDVIVGGWTKTESPEVTDEVKAVLEKATAELDGATYEPVAYLGTQVVAGTNHLILCKVTPVVPDAVSTYALVTVYEKLDGSAEITEVLNSKAEAGVSEATDLEGGWTDSESLAMTEDAVNAFVFATDNKTNASYSTVALLGTQVVAGVNYRLLCEVTPDEPNAESRYAIVVIYSGVDGTTSITETFYFGDEAAQ